MSDDLHARFEAWLAEGALGDPPRDAAIHASVCPNCLHKSAALDALRSIDLGLAALPPSRVPGPAVVTRRPVAWARGSAAAAVVVLAVVTGAIAAPLLGGARNGQGEQQVLDATGTPAADATSPTVRASSERSSASATATPTASDTDSPTSSVSASTGGVPQPPVTSRPSAATARPSATATPRSATPQPTATPTPTASPVPTPTPTLTPTPTPTPTPVETPTPTPVEPPPPS